MAVWTRCIGGAFAAVLLLISARALGTSDYGPFSVEQICKAGIDALLTGSEIDY